MKLHANARAWPIGRRLLVQRIEEERCSLATAAEAAGVSERTARRWLARSRAEGGPGLCDDSSSQGALRPGPRRPGRSDRGLRTGG